MIGSLSSAAPLMEICASPIKAIQRLRFSSSMISRLLGQLEKRLTGGRPIRVGVLHADAEERAWSLMRMIQEGFQPDELFVLDLNPILSIYGSRTRSVWVPAPESEFGGHRKQGFLAMIVPR
jgi:fatty acid-binding protein DegV